MGRLDGGHIFVTGGSRGIGAAVVERAAAEGYRICINYRRDRTAAEALQARVAARGGEAMIHAADVADEAAVVAMFAAIDRRFGPLTHLVNNAAVLETQMRVADMDAARLQRVLACNVIGSFLCCREAIRRMSVRHGGRGGVIVNVSSAAARLGSAGEYVDYAASKGAIDTLTTGLAKEVAPEGIRVNAVRPAFIQTDMHASGGEPGRVERIAPQLPMRRGGQPGEVAETIVWLLSEAASYVCGAHIDMAGGL